MNDQASANFFTTDSGDFSDFYSCHFCEILSNKYFKAFYQHLFSSQSMAYGTLNTPKTVSYRQNVLYGTIKIS
jgi:hypothetical protein